VQTKEMELKRRAEREGRTALHSFCKEEIGKGQTTE
jgi:hypothetical protein